MPLPFNRPKVSPYIVDKETEQREAEKICVGEEFKYHWD